MGTFKSRIAKTTNGLIEPFGVPWCQAYVPLDAPLIVSPKWSILECLQDREAFVIVKKNSRKREKDIYKAKTTKWLKHICLYGTDFFVCLRKEVRYLCIGEFLNAYRLKYIKYVQMIIERNLPTVSPLKNDKKPVYYSESS